MYFILVKYFIYKLEQPKNNSEVSVVCLVQTVIVAIIFIACLLL